MCRRETIETKTRRAQGNAATMVDCGELTLNNFVRRFDALVVNIGVVLFFGDFGKIDLQDAAGWDFSNPMTKLRPFRILSLRRIRVRHNYNIAAAVGGVDAGAGYC